MEEIYLCAPHQSPDFLSASAAARFYRHNAITICQPQNLRWRGIDFLASKKPLETQRSHILCTKLPKSF